MKRNFFWNLLMLLFLSCRSNYYEEYPLNVLISNQDVHCANDGEAFKIIKGFDSTSLSKVGEVVILTFDKSCCSEFKKHLMHLSDSVIIVAQVKCYYGSKPHEESYYGCIGSHKVKVVEVENYNFKN